MYYIRTSS